MKRIVYQNQMDKGSTSCGDTTDYYIYLVPLIKKFNFKYGKCVSAYDTEYISGDALFGARDMIKTELLDLIQNYHVDADPNGSARSSVKIEILGRKLILNTFTCDLDKIINYLNRLYTFLNVSIENDQTVEVFGHGKLDVLDCHVVSAARKILQNSPIFTKELLREKIEYIYGVNGILKSNPTVFDDRFEMLEENGYFIRNNEGYSVSRKGETVGVFANFIETTVTIDEEELLNKAK